MTEQSQEAAQRSERTDIYKFTRYGEDHVGYVGDDDSIYEVRRQTSIPIGRVERTAEITRIFRNTQHDEKELGTVDKHGAIYSYGLFEGGELGWLDPDGTVIQGGLIFGEEEIGRVAGPQPHAAAAALLLIFNPEDAEASRQMTR